MELRRLKLSGFKSFVDATELHIEPGLTGIVGPNGCGKSNLLEAIRWVMGEGSARAMRGGGMEDVIFAGTASRPQRDFAEVSLLVGREPGETMPGLRADSDGDLEVIRRIERGAGSAYRANGQDVRAKDVALLFADAATGPHSPALVSQGKIAAVIAARPQERRAMLEEAAGIAGLHVRRKDAEQKLRAAESNLARLDEMLTEMDNRAATLRRQARAAERYTRLSEQIRLGEARVLFVRWRESAAQAEAAQAEAEQAEAAVAETQAAQVSCAQTVADALFALTRARAEAQQARDAATDAGHRLVALKAERDAAERRIADLHAQAARLDQDREREGALAHDAVEAIARLEREIAMLDERVAQARATLPGMTARLAAAREEARQGELDLAKAVARQASEQAEWKVAQASLSAAAARADRATREQARIAAEQDDLPQIRPLEEEAAAHHAARTRAHERQQAAEVALASAQDEHAQAEAERAEAETALSSAGAALAALDAEAKALERDLSARKDGGGVIDAVRAAPGYEHALAAALGDDLMIATDASAASHWAGADPRSDDPALPAGLAALADHVTAPPQLARRLAQIAVAEADSGQPLAVGQRLVTKDGQLRRWDGLVAKDRGASAAQRLVRVNRLSAIETERPTLATAKNAAAARLDAARAALAAASTAATDARTTMQQAAAQEAHAARQAEDVAARIARAAERAEDAARRVAMSEVELEAARTEQASAAATLAALPDSATVRAEVEALTAVSEAARAALTQLQAECALTERTIDGDTDRLAAAKAEIDGWRARSGEAVRRSVEMTARGAQLSSELEALAGEPERLATALAALHTDNMALTERAEALRKAEQEAEYQLRTAEQAQSVAADRLGAARERRAGAVARAEAASERRVDIARECGEKFECPPAVLPERVGFSSDEVRAGTSEQAELERAVIERERLGPVNLVAATELAELEDVQVKSRAEAAEITQAIHQLRGSVGSLNREGRARLLAAFEAVDAHFRRLFTTLFNGGQARLELVDSDDPLEAGLEILAQPPGKKLSTLTLLSGGEQALTAVALIFGLFLTNPAPICVLDEVDAPLDDANVERFCDLLDAMVAETRTRYLIVTHNAVTMARMHRLFGVTMVERGVSRLVSVDLGGAESLLAAE